jgi:valyl-tRNA synthetase
VDELKRAYEPGDIEQRLYEKWLAAGDFTADPADPADPYCIVIPPPNVTGSLHIGHALVNTLQDVLMRWQRMLGKAALWMPGTDHAGIATQLMVERKLREEGKTKEEIGREAFDEEIWAWKEENGGRILHQLRQLGASCDWTRTRFTLDEGLSAAVRKVFVDLHEQGLIYRAPYIVNWCPQCGTALSDLEAEHVDKESKLWSFAYQYAEGEGELVVATTRPETLLGDTALAVNPKDERYTHLVGKKVVVPLIHREIPVIADEHVGIEFGTGVVKVTPAHDPNDHEIGKRHDLPLVQVIGKDGNMTAEAGPYAGLDRTKARLRVLEDLLGEGLMRGEKEHAHAVAECQRCRTVLEPLVSTQWWVKIQPLADKAIAAVEDGRTKIVPDQYRKIYLNWMSEIRDWCISRQLWWGHRIPAWHCADCPEVTVGETDPTACGSCGSDSIEQDPDVLDTWFSSALWPFSTMGWPDEDSADLKKWYPTSVLVTGHDILFFWVARMMMMGLWFKDEVPFKEVFLHGLVRDSKNKKMSKTTGNVVDPLEVIQSHGADAMRFTLAVMCVPARDIPWDPNRMEGYRTFANKLWQASRFVQMNLTEGTTREFDTGKLDLADQWILTRLQRTAREMNQALEDYRFHEAANLIYHFAWNEYCAWAIEAAKPTFFAKDGPLAEIADNKRSVMLAVLDDTLRLLHPFMPFLTEELWLHFPHEGDTIQRAPYPVGDEKLEFQEGFDAFVRMQELVGSLRAARKEAGIPESKRVPLRLAVADEGRLEELRSLAPVIGAMAKSDPPELESGTPDRTGCLAVESAGISALVPLEGLIDAAAETVRINEQIGKVEKELKSLTGRLNSKGFTDKAPAAVIQTARDKQAELEDKKSRLQNALAALSG